MEPPKSESAVIEFQQKLRTLGFDPGLIDGVIGPQTTKATKQFQSRYNLDVDGIAGPATLKYLEEVYQEKIAAKPAELPQPILLAKKGNTQIYALQTEEAWQLPFDALVLCYGASIERAPGNFAEAFFYSPDYAKYKLESWINSHVKVQQLEPQEPQLVSLPPELGEHRFVILAIGENLTDIPVVTEAIIALAAKENLSYLVLPLIGTGGHNLDVYQVTKSMLTSIQKSLKDNLDYSQIIKNITIVSNQEKNIKIIEKVSKEIFKSTNFIGQKLDNDLPEGEDLLKIKNEVDALAEVLLLRDLEPPIAVGILGGWGSGKSFVMNLLKQKMNEIRSYQLTPENKCLYPFVGHIYQIKFDAWTYTRSNLWASLMQTIFAELNRQITLEKQLEKAGVPAIEGGSIWRVLNEMSNEEREAILNSELMISAEEWKEISASNDVANALLKSIEKIKEKEINELQETEQQLLQKEKDLQDKLITIETEVDRDIKIKSEAVVWEPLAKAIESSISRSLVEAINQDEQFLTSVIKNFFICRCFSN